MERRYVVDVVEKNCDYTVTVCDGHETLLEFTGGDLSPALEQLAKRISEAFGEA